MIEDNGVLGRRMRAHSLLGRHADYLATTMDGQSDFGIPLDDLPKSSPAPAPTKWRWAQVLRIRSETGRIFAAYLLLGTLSLLTWMYYEDWNIGARQAVHCPHNDNVSCYSESTEDDLPPLDTKPTMGIIQLLSNARDRWGQDYVTPGADARNIFLVHATCEQDLTPLQACAVEAAARLHPRWSVHVVFGGPVSVRRALQVGGLLPVVAYPNVRFARVSVLDYLWGTPFYHSAWALSLRKKSYKTMETLLKFGTLYKHDGVVLDLGRVLGRPLDALGGVFLTSQLDGNISSAAIGLQGSFREAFCEGLALEVTHWRAPACVDFTGEPALSAMVDHLKNFTFGNESVITPLPVYSLTSSTGGPLFRPPTAGPTTKDCPSVFNYTAHLKATQHSLPDVKKNF